MDPGMKDTRSTDWKLACYNKNFRRVRQFGACQIVWWESTPGKGVAPSRYTALEPKPRGEV